MTIRIKTTKKSTILIIFFLHIKKATAKTFRLNFYIQRLWTFKNEIGIIRINYITIFLLAV